PFEKWGGLKFLEAAHVKDVLAFLRILENPRDDVSWYRVLHLLPGVGDVTARAAVALLAERSWDPRAFAVFTPPRAARAAHASLVTLLDTLGAPGNVGPRAVSEEIALLRTMYDAILRDRYDRVEPRLADLDQLEAIAGQFPSRAAFLSELALDPPSGTQDLAGAADTESDALILSTAHSAKGREWDAVFVIWAVDGWFPSARALRSDDDTDEERRLMYVALTRARNALCIVHPLDAYGARGGSGYAINQLSRFLDERVRAYTQRMVAVPDVSPSAAATGVSSELIDLRALLRGRFGGS
ncbi:MAG: 3'-5' exonuclease, partial [Gemmatimonadaceae bacterium]